jgi:hypothetical protein
MNYHNINEQTQITIRRTTNYADRLRAYKIKIDDVVVGQVRAGDSITIPITSGRHSIILRIDWCGSHLIDFDVQTGENVIFECGSSLGGWRVFLAIFYIVFFTDQYLWLRRTS